MFTEQENGSDIFQAFFTMQTAILWPRACVLRLIAFSSVLKLITFSSVLRLITYADSVLVASCLCFEADSIFKCFEAGNIFRRFQADNVCKQRSCGPEREPQMHVVLISCLHKTAAFACVCGVDLMFTRDSCICVCVCVCVCVVCSSHVYTRQLPLIRVSR
jgi:hypothetical protein